MKLIITLLITSLLSLSVQGLFWPTVKATSENLIYNGTLDTVTPNVTPPAPAGWQTGKWGSNETVFSYHRLNRLTQDRFATIRVTSYTDGDAKWYFTPVDVKPETDYIFTDSYRATVATHTVAEATLADGSIEYLYLGQNPKSTKWKTISYQFKTSASAAKVTVFHLLNDVGKLDVNTFALTEVIPVAPAGIVPNPSVEQTSNGIAPDSWLTGGWGNNVSTLTYLNSGHSGNKSLQVDVTQYTDGDAKWYFAPQTVVAGQTYKITNFYKASVPTDVVLAFSMQDGSTQYMNLHDAETAPVWTEYSDTFIAPIGSVAMTAFHLINRVGSLTTDDYKISPYQPVGFDQAYVSLTFDDGWQSQYTNAMPILNEFHMPATFYITSGFLDTFGYITLEQLLGLKANGQQIGAHTVSHAHLPELDDEHLHHELVDSKRDLEAIVGTPIVDFASPYGEYNQHVVDMLRELGYRSQRSVESGYISRDTLNLMNLKVQNVEITTTQREIEAWLDKAKADKTWLILVYHQVDHEGGQYSTTPEAFRQQLQAIQTRNITVKTVDQTIAATQ